MFNKYLFKNLAYIGCWLTLQKNIKNWIYHQYLKTGRGTPGAAVQKYYNYGIQQNIL